MSKAKEADKMKAAGVKLPPQGFSKFSKGPAFGIQNLARGRAQFSPPMPRITQNKGGGGK